MRASETLPAVAPFVSMREQVRGYKYLVNAEGAGWACADRFLALLSSDSLVLKQQSTNVEFWYHLLRPGEHYVPVATDWHNLRARILQLRANDSAAAAIAANARAFVGGFSAEVSVCAALKAVAEYAALATPARWEETVRGLLAAPHLPLVEVYSAARKT